MVIICPGCGGFFDESTKICPICNYDLGNEIRKEKNKKLLEKWKKISKYVLIVAAITAVIVAAIMIIRGVAHADTISKRISSFTSNAEDALYNTRISSLKINVEKSAHDSALLSRINDVSFNLDGLKYRFVYAIEQANNH